MYEDTQVHQILCQMRVYCCNTVLLIKVLNDPPWHKQQPENTVLFPFTEDVKI